MGEGWSDFYSLMLTQKPADLQNDAYPVGTYVKGQAINGSGIRRKPYSFNMTTDPLTFNAYGSSGTTSYGIARSTEVHNAGELWATTLWDLNWLLINNYGYDSNLYTGWTAAAGAGHAGNKLALRLVMDGMKLQPANPSFTQARDAILAADVNLTGGANAFQIWQAFARRGLGANVATQSATSTSTITADTTIPASAMTLQVTTTTPAAQSIVSTAPTSFTLNLTDALDETTVDASDFTVNGAQATGVSYTPGSTNLTFTFDISPVSTQGLQTMQMATGAVARASDANPLQVYLSSFRYESLPLAVTSTTPTSGSISDPMGFFDINLNEPVDPASVDTGDLRLSAGYDTGFTLLNGNTTIRFAIPAVEATFTASIPAGALTDIFGNPSVAFSGTYSLDYITRAYTTPLTAIAPLGSAVCRGVTMTGIVNNGTDTDDYTLSIDAGQSFSAVVTAASALKLQVTVFSPTNTVLTSTTATANGQTVITTPVVAPTTGLYTVRIGSSAATSGAYTIQEQLNAAVELESNGGVSNNTVATAQSLNTANVTTSTSIGSAKRAAVLGVTDSAAAGTYTASAVSYAFDDISSTGTALSFANTDDASKSITSPFSFSYFGTSNTTIFVSTNGLITFGSGLTTATNTNLASSSTPSQATIAAFWDDLVVNSSGGVLWQVLGTTGSRRLVIQWNNAQFWSQAGGNPFSLTFQMELFEGTNHIRFNYANLTAGVTAQNEGLSATVGLKNVNTNTNSLSLDFNTGPNSFVGSGKSTLISPSAPTADYYSFTTTSPKTVSVGLNSLAAGTLTLQLFDTNGTSLIATGSTGSTNITSAISNVSLPVAGTYFVAVSSGGATATSYNLSILSDTVADAETNDTALTAEPLGALRAVTGYLSAANDDWYTLTLPISNDAITVETATPGDGAGEFSNTLDPVVRIYDATGTTLLSTGVTLADGHNDTATVTGLVPGTTYAIRLSPAGSTIGEYVLNASTFTAVPNVQGFVVNGGDSQRSRIVAIEVQFSGPVNPADYSGLGAIQFKRTLTASVPFNGAAVGDIVQTGDTTPGVGIVTVAAGSTGNSLLLTFAINNDSSSLTVDESKTVEHGSLTDGFWQLILGSYSSTAGDVNLRRLYGDSTNTFGGTVNGSDLIVFGNVFSSANVAFDFNNDGTVNGADLIVLGNLFSNTL
ncbi:hypothetical protein BH11PLA2_BH11PLA2_46040 [soil metagenome]